MSKTGGDAWNAVKDFEESGAIPGKRQREAILAEAERLEAQAKRYRRVLAECERIRGNGEGEW